jgi:hypothetical protein
MPNIAFATSRRIVESAAAGKKSANANRGAGPAFTNAQEDIKQGEDSLTSQTCSASNERTSRKTYVIGYATLAEQPVSCVPHIL